MFIIPTPSELHAYQLTKYAELMKNAKSWEAKVFARKELFRLKNIQK